MNLTLKDRVIILNSVLPKFDTRQNIELIKSIREKIILTESESSAVVARDMGNNQFDLSFKTIDAITASKWFEFSNEENEYLQNRVDFIDSNGMFSEFSMDTYCKIINKDNETKCV